MLMTTSGVPRWSNPQWEEHLAQVPLSLLPAAPFLGSPWPPLPQPWQPLHGTRVALVGEVLGRGQGGWEGNKPCLDPPRLLLGANCCWLHWQGV
jgi:hypothetical protein